jgi:hypothetical protein
MVIGGSAPNEFIGLLFDKMNINLRQAISILNGLRMFSNQWRHDFPFEIVTVIYYISLKVVGKLSKYNIEDVFKIEHTSDKIFFRLVERI